MTRKQLEGLKYCPDKRVREAVASALSYCQRADDAEQQVRELQERLAAVESDYRVLVVLHKDGWVEVCCGKKIPVKFAHVPELGRGREDEADTFAVSRLPVSYKEIYDAKVAHNTCKGCLSREGYKLLKMDLEAIALVRAVEQEVQRDDH